MGEKKETSDILDLKVNINDGTQSKPDESNVAFKAARSPISTDSCVPFSISTYTKHTFLD